MRSDPHRHVFADRRRWKASRSTGRRRPSRGVGGAWASVGPAHGSGSPPLPAFAPATADVRRAPRMGTTSASALRSGCARRERPSHASHVRVATRPLLGPLTRARRSPLQLRRSKAGGGGAFESTSRSGKPAQAGRTGTGVEASGRRAARRASPSRKGAGVTRQKRKDVMASVPARIVRAQAPCPHVVAVAEIGRRRPVSNKLGKRAPKRAVRVE